MSKKKKAARKPSREGSSPKKADAKYSDPSLHVYGKNNNILCLTNSRGYATPENRDPAALIMDATNGFVPLWGPGVNLRWRFNEFSMRHASNPEKRKEEIKNLVGEAMLLWGADAAPITLSLVDSSNVWDFEFTLRKEDDCITDPGGNRRCTLARAFFPDSGQHDLALYPILFDQPFNEQVKTMAHELGHVFGLRHFFAELKESWAPSRRFGTHSRFSIMNYGSDSVMTDADRSDLKTLYQMVWSGQLPSINGTPVVQFRPYHEFLNQPFSSVAPQPAVRSGIAANQCPCCSCRR